MPSIPIPIRGAKEPVDSRWPYLKPLIKEEGKKEKSQKAQKLKGKEKPRTKRRYAKRGVVKVPRRTWFLVQWVPKIIKILPKRHFKSKEGLLVKTPT